LRELADHVADVPTNIGTHPAIPQYLVGHRRVTAARSQYQDPVVRTFTTLRQASGPISGGRAPV
jgi:hypothetical protein